MAYRLLALDLDGTVMAADLVISQRVRRAVAAAQERGVIVTLATGRMYAAALPFARELGLRDPLICYQGALVRHPVTGEIFYHLAMPPGPAAEVTAALIASDIFVIAYIDERMCIERERPELEVYMRFHPEGAELVVDPELPARVAATPPTKLLFVAEPDVVGRALDELAPRFGGQLALTRSHALFGELTAPGVSKGVALASLAERLGVRREEVIAIGDQENDLSMISWAGLGLAMGNAIPAVKEAAAAVLPSVADDGVAVAIEKYIALT